MPESPRTLRLRLSYDGSDFHGWQVQPGLATVQQTVQDALAALSGEPVHVHGSGRTDAGVHALAQVAHCEVQRLRIPLTSLQRALNSHLPASIRIDAVDEVAAGFDARRDAVSKLYRYRIWRDAVCPPFLRRYVYHHPYPLNETAMAAAAPRFAGAHDFRSFAATPAKGAPAVATTVRTVLRSELHRQGPELVYEVEGRGFLHHMVRNLLGFLLDVGRGTRRGEEIPAVLAAANRRAAGPTAPACGLYLVRVSYDGKFDGTFDGTNEARDGA